MSDWGLSFHHLGLAVGRPAKAVAFLSGLGYRVGPAVRDERQNVNIHWCLHDAMPAVEVLFPTETEGPLNPYLQMAPEMIYHTCYATADVAGAVAAMRGAGHRVVCVAPPKPAMLFADRLVSFYRVAGFGLIELLDLATDSDTGRTSVARTAGLRQPFEAGMGDGSP